MTKDRTPQKQTTMTNGWFCPQCKKLTEHTIIYERVRTNGNDRNERLLICIVCKTRTIIKAKNPFRERLAARQGSKKSLWLRFPRKKGQQDGPELVVEKRWGRPRKILINSLKS